MGWAFATGVAGVNYDCHRPAMVYGRAERSSRSLLSLQQSIPRSKPSRRIQSDSTGAYYAIKPNIFAKKKKRFATSPKTTRSKHHFRNTITPSHPRSRNTHHPTITGGLGKNHHACRSAPSSILTSYCILGEFSLGGSGINVGYPARSKGDP